MSNKNWATALHELQYVDGDKKMTVSPNTTLSMSKETYDEFTGLNAIRAATSDEIDIAKSRGGEGVTETSVEAEQAAAEAAAKAAADESAKQEAAKADAKASEAVAAESDRNREAAKQEAAAKVTKPAAAKPVAASKNDPLA